MKPHKLNSIAVYCGSSTGYNAQYTESAKDLAKLFVAENITLVYGGAKVGIMGILAEEILSRGGKAIGVIPQLLVNKEVAHDGLTDLFIVNNMHERKAMMADLSDGFMMLPGGPGSLDEFFEIFTWAKLGYHNKPFGILNTANYYDHLIQFINHSEQEGFLKTHERELVHIDACPQNLLDKFKRFHVLNMKEEVKTNITA
jgi:uncharacterized protein (TIGR00730 family)